MSNFFNNPDSSFNPVLGIEISQSYTQHCENVLLETTLQFGGASSSGLPYLATAASGAIGCYVQIASGNGGIRIRQDGIACTPITGLKFLNETSVTPTIIKLMSYSTGLPLNNIQIYATDTLLNIVYFKL